MNAPVRALLRDKVLPPGIKALCRELMTRDHNLLGPEITVAQKDVNAFCALTADTNPLHRGGKNRFADGPIVPGLMLISLIPKLSGIELPFELDGLNLLNRGGQHEFRFPVPVDAPIRMRFRPVGEPDVSILGCWIDISFEILLAASGKEAVRGSIALGYS